VCEAHHHRLHPELAPPVDHREEVNPKHARQLRRPRPKVQLLHHFQTQLRPRGNVGHAAPAPGVPP